MTLLVDDILSIINNMILFTDDTMSLFHFFLLQKEKIILVRQ